ncbi:MAG: N-6 DNA methylase, partial [Mariprofundales bacterium]|nr:N-6 DNA methylase [Mariprofundales bacterium]
MPYQALANKIWSVADTIRGDSKKSEFGQITLPFAVLRRLECVLELTRDEVVAQYEAIRGDNLDLDLILPGVAEATFYNTSKFSLATLGSTSTRQNLEAYISGFSSNARQVSEWNHNARLIPYAQELNPETHAICVADKLIQGYDTRNIKQGNTLSDDQLPHERFDYCLANPPFGVDWKKVQKQVANEHRLSGYDGRFGPGLPRVNDCSMLFLMHLLSKRKPASQGGTRIGIVLSGSPLFNGGAGSGESEIRRWILENDWLEAIIALPTDMFYNTGIGTYIWILSTNKEERRQGLVQLIDATGIHTPMRKSLGSKRRMISDEQIEESARIHDAFEESEHSKIFNTTDFGYRRITVERPLQLRFSVTP